jgi:pSer/pThr/pTyr-binding forkhead associated (FHA) protein
VFEQGTTTIGRANNNTISLDDTAVSSHHAKIVTLFHTSYIEDLDSTNGTLVNGKPVHKHTLHSGDVIAVGNHQLLFQSENGAQKTSETSDTMMLHGNEIKRKLNEFMQAQSDLDHQRNKAQPAVINKEEVVDIASPLKNSEVPNSKTPPAFGTSPSLDREKNKAWLDPKKSPPAGEKPPPVIESKADVVSNNKPNTPAANAEPSPLPHTMRNTAAAIRESASPAAPATPEPASAATNTLDEVASDSTSPTTTNTPTTVAPSPRSEKPVIDIAAAARAATQRSRRSGDNDFSPDGVMALNRSKTRNKIMPMVWMLIVAVLLVEVIYITFRTIW